MRGVVVGVDDGDHSDGVAVKVMNVPVGEGVLVSTVPVGVAVCPFGSVAVGVREGSPFGGGVRRGGGGGGTCGSLMHRLGSSKMAGSCTSPQMAAQVLST